MYLFFSFCISFFFHGTQPYVQQKKRLSSDTSSTTFKIYFQFLTWINSRTWNHHSSRGSSHNDAYGNATTPDQHKTALLNVLHSKKFSCNCQYIFRFFLSRVFFLHFKYLSFSYSQFYDAKRLLYYESLVYNRKLVNEGLKKKEKKCKSTDSNRS